MSNPPHTMQIQWHDKIHWPFHENARDRGSMWSSVNPWSADTQEARLHIYVLDMLAAGFGIHTFIIILSIIPNQLLAWQLLYVQFFIC